MHFQIDEESNQSVSNGTNDLLLERPAIEIPPQINAE